MRYNSKDDPGVEECVCAVQGEILDEFMVNGRTLVKGVMRKRGKRLIDGVGL